MTGLSIFQDSGLFRNAWRRFPKLSRVPTSKMIQGISGGIKVLWGFGRASESFQMKISGEEYNFLLIITLRLTPYEPKTNITIFVRELNKDHAAHGSPDICLHIHVFSSHSCVHVILAKARWKLFPYHMLYFPEQRINGRLTSDSSGGRSNLRTYCMLTWVCQ